MRYSPTKPIQLYCSVGISFAKRKKFQMLLNKENKDIEIMTTQSVEALFFVNALTFYRHVSGYYPPMLSPPLENAFFGYPPCEGIPRLSFMPKIILKEKKINFAPVEMFFKQIDDKETTPISL
jgi:hypothetical protein